ncbi:hypothetical protein [Gloeobacter morelensis]|uniref:DUF3887 domain-containing protein n=1 Tax=Gloeobacter morelensis MG652769 TaxID=2781736 RepID=A0ABY3PGD3_9CYAN|nr:hypothetical protein [Gloeobacter morelensis]UFP92699.1 hypothetical protein ISF26_12705 [Gloeobacter morelensis MG652769]
MLIWLLAAPGNAQLPAPIEPDAPPKPTPQTPRRRSPPRRTATAKKPTAQPVATDPRYDVARRFLEQLNRGEWAPALLSAEFRDEIDNEFEAGRLALLAPGALGQLKSGRAIANAQFNYAIERLGADGKALPSLYLRLINVVGQWQIDGFDPKSMAQPKRRPFRQDTFLPTSEDRLFNTMRLLRLPPLDPSQQQNARGEIGRLFEQLDSPNRRHEQLIELFGPRMRERLRTEADLNKLLQPNNLGRLRVLTGEPGTAMMRIELADRQGAFYLGAAFVTFADGRMTIDAIDYYGPGVLDRQPQPLQPPADPM